MWRRQKYKKYFLNLRNSDELTPTHKILHAENNVGVQHAKPLKSYILEPDQKQERKDSTP